jgi:hypothetical protein
MHVKYDSLHWPMLITEIVLVCIRKTEFFIFFGKGNLPQVFLHHCSFVAVLCRSACLGLEICSRPMAFECRFTRIWRTSVLATWWVLDS